MHPLNLDLIDALAGFISDYRDVGDPPALMRDAALAAFPGATGSDFARGLLEANRRERADAGNG